MGRAITSTWCDHDFGGFRKQGDSQEELDFHDRKIGRLWRYEGEVRFIRCIKCNRTWRECD